MKEILTPKIAERIQNEIWRKTPTAKKIKMLRQLFRFMNKIAAKKNKDFREFLKPLYDKTSSLAEGSEDVIRALNRRNLRRNIKKLILNEAKASFRSSILQVKSR